MSHKEIRIGPAEQRVLSRLLGAAVQGRPVALSTKDRELCALLLDKAQAADLGALVDRLRARIPPAEGQQRLTLDDLAELTGYSRETICRIRPTWQARQKAGGATR